MLKFGNTFVNVGGTYLTGWDCFVPPDLQPGVLRIKYKDGVVPSWEYATFTQVSVSPNVWDITPTYKTRWNNVLYWSNRNDILEMVWGNSEGVQYMNDMFAGCTALSAVNGLDTTNITDLSTLFFHCNSLSSAPMLNTTNCTSMNSMFAGCPISTVPNYNTNNVKNMTDMFNSCNNLTGVPTFNTTNVIKMDTMFYGCSSLREIPLFDTSNVTSMYSTFEDCSGLSSLPLLNTNSLKYAGYTFENCVNVVSGALALYTQMSTQPSITSHNGCFRNCGSNTQAGAAELAQIPDDWK